MRIISIIILCCITIINDAAAQKNIVYNPSFEEHWYCPPPLPLVDSFPCKGWHSTDFGTPDYYNSCSITKEFSIKNNSEDNIGFCEPRTGNACLGLAIIGTKHGDMEHIQGHLTEPLIQNQKYIISFWVRLDYQFSDYAAYNIGAFLSQNIKLSDIPKDQSDFYTVLMTPRLKASVANPTYKFIKDTNWVNISGIYIAKGGEKYITIGMFWDDNPNIVKAWEPTHANGVFGIDAKGSSGKEFRHFRKALEKYALLNNTFAERRYKNATGKIGAKLAYYYIDDVSVSEIKDSILASDIKDTIKHIVSAGSTTTDLSHQLTIEANKNIILNNLIFETDKSNIIPVSFDVLNQLVDYLKANTASKIDISGYTDNTGAEQKNLTLSEARAKAVAYYLISKGINNLRISYKGYGSANPIATNETEEGKARNRRVEFKIMEK